MAFRLGLFLSLVLTAGTASAQVTCGPPGADLTVAAGTPVVLNGYYPGPAASGLVTAAAGSTSIAIDSTAARGPVAVADGDLLLIVQLQGATLNNGDQNTVGGPYGDGAAGDDRMGSTTATAGTYELAVAAGPAGATIPLRAPLLNTYTHSSTVVDNGDGTGIGFRRYQIVVVRQFRNLTVPAGATVTALPWDGRSGGVVALDVSGTLTVAGSIDVSGLGFRGGSSIIPAGNDQQQAAVKGEGLAGPTSRMYGFPVTAGTTLTVTTGPVGIFGTDNGRGGPGNAGGCPTLVGAVGSDTLGPYNDSGGGGGGGGGDGGNGQTGPSAGSAAERPRGGAGYNDVTRLFLGGGGGSGSVDDATGGGGPVSLNGTSGQPGGGIIYVRAAAVAGTGTLQSSGRSSGTTLTTEGGGGGGGGGSIFLYTSTTTIPVTLRARGGNGTSTNTADDAGGGGGGGGHIVVATPGGTATVTVDVAGGAGGTSPNRPAAGGGVGGFQQVAAPPVNASCPAFTVCGDRMVEAPETCDDGNAMGGDGCGATCRREVVIVMPADGSTTTDRTPTISGTADPGATVVVTVGTQTLMATANAGGNWSVTAATLPRGANTATANATATDGSTSTDSSTFTIDDRTVVAITSPTSGATTSAMPTITGTGEAGAMVTVTIDGTVVGTVTVGPGGTWSIPAGPLTAGMHDVSAMAMDMAGNTASAGPVPFIVDDGTMVAITAPTGGARTDATPTITGTGEAGATVTISIDGTVVGTATVSAGGTWTFDAPMQAAGMHTVSVTARDAVGNTAADGPETFVVDDSTVVAITDPSSGETTDATPVISGTGEPGAMVTVSIDGSVVGTATVTAGGTWSVSVTSPLSAGDHTASATAVDDVGNTATATPVDFVVDDDTNVAITTPDEGSTTADTTPTLSGTGEAGATIEVVLTGPGGATVTVSTTVAADGTWTVDVSSGLANGMWTAVATATDGVGNTATDMQSFTVDAATFVTITSPADGSSTPDTTPTITGTGEPGAMVTVTVDGTTVGTATVGADGTWSIDVTTALSMGSHTAVATATLGGMTAMATSTFTIAEMGTFVTFDQPGGAGPIGDTTPELSGTGEPGATVEVTLDGTVVGSALVDAEGNWTLQLTTPVTEGPHTVSVEATDVDGNSATDTGSFTVDTDVPSLEIDAPANHATTGSMPTITGRTDPNATVTVIIDGRILGTATASDDGVWSFPITTALASGDHTVQATTTNAAGLTANDTHDFTVDADAPAVRITSPANGSSTDDPTPTITGTSDPGDAVQVFVGGVLVGTVMAAADGTWSIDVTSPLPDGDHTVRAVARDAAGNTATASGTFIVDTATFVTIDRPADGSTINAVRPTYFGTAEPGDMVEVSVDGTVIGTVVAAPDGSWSIPQPADLSAGMHTVEATATDELGNSATASNDFTIDTSILDTDGDGIVDPTECPTPGSCPDTDGDGDPDFDDPDDDGDGVPTAIECPMPGSCPDSDGDGTVDYLDPDDDGDGVPTRDERPGDVSIDTDGDGRPNYLDTDDDGDGLPTMEECSDSTACRDTDTDTTPDYLDPDDDDDGILTSRERADGMMFGNDVDGDGDPNWLDTNSDGDSRPDMEEGLLDSDGMGPPDYLDPNETPADAGVTDGSVGDGAMNADAGPTPGGISGGACGCRVGGSSDGARGLVLLGLALGAILIRRRR